MTTISPAHDPQQEAVYYWEDAFVATALPREVLSWNEATGLALEAATWLRIRPPAIHHVPSDSLPCLAVPSTWTLRIADWGRTRLTILHEVAHLGTIAAVASGEAGHGPAFAGTALALYARFLGLDPERMLATAAHCGVVATIPQGLAPPSRKPRKSPFADMDF